MKRIMVALSVLFYGLPEVSKLTFGREQAMAIYRAAMKKFSGDEEKEAQKVVAFSILQTAVGFNADITVFDEAKAQRSNIASEIQHTTGSAAATVAENETYIKDLEAAKVNAEQLIAKVKENAEDKVNYLTMKDDEEAAMVEFFGG